MKAESRGEAEARENAEMAERPVLDTCGRPRGLAFPTASEQAQGARNPAVHVQAGLLLGQCMHRELLGTDEGADGRHGATPSEGAMAPAGRHVDCCSNRRGQERPGWLTPMEHAGRFTAQQCAGIGVHLNSKILLSASSGRKARAPQQPQAPGLPVHGRQR